MSCTEKRRTSRLPVSLEIHYSTPLDVFTRFSDNLNEGGLFIETAKPSPVGMAVEIEFYLPDDPKPIKTRGVVVWSTASKAQGPRQAQANGKCGMGIEFEQINAADRERVNGFCKRLRSHP